MPPLMPALPTARQLVASGHAIAASSFVLARWSFGVEVIAHVVPSQNSPSVAVVSPLGVLYSPTTVHAVLDVHDTEYSEFDCDPDTFGVD